MRRIEALIKLVRSITDNSNTNTMTNDVVVSFFNDAQKRIESVIYQAHPESNFFNTVGFISIVSGTDKYSLLTLKDVDGVEFTSHMLTGMSITLVELAEGSGSDYFPLDFISNKERINGEGFILNDTNIIITPQPSSGSLRITYPKKLPTLDIRRGVIQTATASTSIVLTTALVPTEADMSTVDYITVVDFDGNIIREKIKVLSYDFATRTITTDDALTSVVAGQYIVFGEYSTSHCKLDDCIERYLKEYTCLRIFMMDSSKDTTVQSRLVSSLEDEISGLYADNINDVMHIPVISTEYMNF